MCVKEGDIIFALGFLSLQIMMMTKESCVDCRNPSLQARFEVQQPRVQRNHLPRSSTSLRSLYCQGIKKEEQRGYVRASLLEMLLFPKKRNVDGVLYH